MSFRTVLAFADGGEDTKARLATAAMLAEDWGAHLTALALTEHPRFDIGYQGVASSRLYFEEVGRAHEEASALADELGAELRELGRSGDTRWASDSLNGVPEIAAIHARYADIAIVAQPLGETHRKLRAAVCEGVLFDSGGPALMLPEGWNSPLGTKVMVAWKPTRESARALHDALPLINAAGAVTLVLVDPVVGEREFGPEPGADIAAMLVRHGVTVEVERPASSDRSVGETLLASADSLGADLIVMGAYGHSRLRQTIFGGVTRDVLAAARVPVLLSH